MGDSITEGTVFKLEKKVGDFVDADEIVAVVETDKVKVDIRSPEAGKILQFFANEGDTIEVGKKFFEVDTALKGDAKSAKKETANATPEDKTAKKQEHPHQADPKKDAESKKAHKPSEEAPKNEEPKKEKKDAPKPTQQVATATSKKTGPASREERREPMSRMRQKIGQRLKDAQNTYALLTTFQEVDMGNVMQYRNDLQNEFQKK